MTGTLTRTLGDGLPWAVLLTLAVWAPGLHGQTAQNDDPIPFQSYELENGLTVILAPDEGSTAVAVNLWYDVGSRHEPPGRSGFAHLFEHLMFEGSENVEPGEHMLLVERAGGSVNASITEDRTNYFQTLPPERVNLALWLEAERLRNLEVTEENMAREVEVVKEERRQRYDNSPYGTTQLQAFYYAAYDSTSCFPYAHSVIGSMEDLDAAELDDVQAFFDTHYVPGNATLAVVGAFDPEEVRALIQEYFSPIPPGEVPPEPECTEPFSHLPVKEEVADPNANLPAVFVSYGAVPADHPDRHALRVLTSILGTGETSRLHQGLVRESQVAVDASSFALFRKDPGLLVFLAIANQGIEPEELLEALDREVERIVEEGVTPEEVERAGNRQRANEILERQTVMGRAEALQRYNHFHGTPEAIRGDLEGYLAVTPEDVQEVARRYLDPENRAVLITRPGPSAEEADGPPGPDGSDAEPADQGSPDGGEEEDHD